MAAHIPKGAEYFMHLFPSAVGEAVRYYSEGKLPKPSSSQLQEPEEPKLLLKTNICFQATKIFFRSGAVFLNAAISLL